MSMHSLHFLLYSVVIVGTLNSKAENTNVSVEHDQQQNYENGATTPKSHQSISQTTANLIVSSPVTNRNSSGVTMPEDLNGNKSQSVLLGSLESYDKNENLKPLLSSSNFSVPIISSTLVVNSDAESSNAPSFSNISESIIKNFTNNFLPSDFLNSSINLENNKEQIFIPSFPDSVDIMKPSEINQNGVSNTPNSSPIGTASSASSDNIPVTPYQGLLSGWMGPNANYNNSKPAANFILMSSLQEKPKTSEIPGAGKTHEPLMNEDPVFWSVPELPPIFHA